VTPKGGWMTQKNINAKPFDQGTLLKLDIFSSCFKAWLPVFLYDKYTSAVHIFDLFAGSGTDSEGTYGSPLRLLAEARGEKRKNCLNANKSISFTFGESLKGKYLELDENVKTAMNNCVQQNGCNKCVYDYAVIQAEFHEVFSDSSIKRVFENRDIGKFVLLDQNGFREVDDKVFLQLISYPKTDFIFFISSSFIKRFKTHPNTLAYIETDRIEFDGREPRECHRVIADYFRKLIPAGKSYYIHHFTIQKGSNYYGLIFGTSHTYGMEKFLQVCWGIDPLSGEANFNIDNNFGPGSLFYKEGDSNKLDKVRNQIKSCILSGQIKDNTTGLLEALKAGCEPKIFTEVVKELEKQKMIYRRGNVNNQSTRIHNVARYNIEV
jgi:three-Cys-motif partner protein